MLLNTISGVEKDNGRLTVYGLVHTTGTTLEDLLNNATVEATVDGAKRILSPSDLAPALQYLVRNAIKYRYLEVKDENN